jgi:aspartate/methionine/tyrosine aminotransferase
MKSHRFPPFSPNDILLDAPDAGALREYLAQNNNIDDAILMNIGESWQGPPEGLRKRLASTPDHAHGYQLSMFGVPALRSAQFNRIVDQHELTEKQVEHLEIGITATGTRSVMYDFGEFVRSSASDISLPNYAITVSPGWDYSSTFASIGFTCVKMQISHANNFQPEFEFLRDIVSEIERTPRGSILWIINAQHNPTGANWTSDFLSNLFALILSTRDCAVLIDDAYYSASLPLKPTNALKQWLTATADRPTSTKWVQTRSFGKEFRCNGWGVGSYLSSSEIVGELAQHYASRRTYNIGATYQHALSQWLNQREHFEFVEHSRNRREINFRHFCEWSLATHNAYGLRGFCTGFVPYGIFQCPPSIDKNHFTRECMRQVGVLVSTFVDGSGTDFVRLYLDLEETVLQEGLERIASFLRKKLN